MVHVQLFPVSSKGKIDIKLTNNKPDATYKFKCEAQIDFFRNLLNYVRCRSIRYLKTKSDGCYDFFIHSFSYSTSMTGITFLHLRINN